MGRRDDGRNCLVVEWFIDTYFRLFLNVHPFSIHFQLTLVVVTVAKVEEFEVVSVFKRRSSLSRTTARCSGGWANFPWRSLTISDCSMRLNGSSNLVGGKRSGKLIVFVNIRLDFIVRLYEWAPAPCLWDTISKSKLRVRRRSHYYCTCIQPPLCMC